nr:type III-A CRISPR-associated protein Cas10/Csm1 [uncultured Prevotella sp.]
MTNIRNQIYLAALVHEIADTENTDDKVCQLVQDYLDKELLKSQLFLSIVSQASRLSAGFSEGSVPHENITWTANTNRMISLTESVFSDRPTHYLLPDKLLKIGKNTFPQMKFSASPNFSALKDDFIKEAQKLKGKSIEAFTESLLYLLERYAVHVPAFTEGEQDVSLYDHAKTTAALAVCLYDWNQEKIGDTPFLLIGADFSGIQGYIYQIVSKYAARNLKGRSFYLRLLSDAVVRFLLRKLHLFRANVIYNSGGGFYFVAPNTQRVKETVREVSEEIERKFFKAHKTSLYLALDSVELSEEDLYHRNKKHNLSVAWSQLFRLREQRKLSKFSNLIEKDYDSFFTPHIGKNPRYDKVTGEEITDQDQKSHDGDESKVGTLTYLNSQQQKLGAVLKDTDVIVVTETPLPSWSKEMVSIEPASLGSIYYFMNKATFIHHVKELDHATFVSMNDDFTSVTGMDLSVTRKDVIIGFNFYGGNQNNGKTFDQLCDFRQREFSRLGVLRMDVDNLGKIFQQGIPKEKATLCRYATLSRLFDYFFSGYLNTIYQETDPDHSQIIYSGGDDLFIVGSWDVMIEMAEKIRKDFADFTCQNPAFSISGGIALVTAKYPIMNASKQSEKEEENAKTHENKNSLSMMGMALDWNKEYPAVKNLKDTIVRLIQSKYLNKAFISKIQILNKQARITFKSVQGKWVRQVSEYRVYWLLAYSMERMVQRSNDKKVSRDFLKQCVNEICSFQGKIGGMKIETSYHPFELWAFAARWAELELRTKEII